MNYTTLITVEQLAAVLDQPDLAVIDCRYVMGDPDGGKRAYIQSHIPGAVYAHLDVDLAAQVEPGKTGRHPLPSVEEFAASCSQWGIDERVQVVAYDDAGGAYASRLWWLLRWVGHEKVAVLDGGFAKWVAEDRPGETGEQPSSAHSFHADVASPLTVDAAFVEAHLSGSECVLIDSRAAERFRGDEEPLDSVAGHIPGAKNLPHKGVLNDSGEFLSQEALRVRFETVLEGRPAEKAVFYCGSGVTACHNILAMQHAGFGGAKLYPGSWSEWITDKNRPVATGD